MPDPLDTATETTTATSEGTQVSTETGKDAAGDTATTTTETTEQTATATTEQTTESEKGKDGEQGKAADEITYEPFTMPEGVELDQAAMDRATPLLKELGLSQDQAQKLVTLYATELQGGVNAALTPEKMQSYMDEIVGQRATVWADQLKADPDIGGAKLDETHALVKEGIAKYGTPALKEALDSTGLGNHPELVRMFRKIGADAREDRGGGPAGGGGVQSLEDRMYPDMKK